MAGGDNVLAAASDTGAISGDAAFWGLGIVAAIYAFIYWTSR